MKHSNINFLTLGFLLLVGIFLWGYYDLVQDCNQETYNYREQILRNQQEYLTLQSKKYNAITLLEKHRNDSALFQKSVQALKSELEQDTIAWRSGAEAMMRGTKSLIDLHLNAVDRQYNSLTLWAAVITILFLIFSFYAIFKLEDTLKQAKDAVKGFEDEANKKIVQVKEEADNRIGEIKKATEEIKKEAKAETLKIVQEAEKQRKLSQAFNEALNAYNEKKYELALNNVKKALGIADDSDKERLYLLQGIIYNESGDTNQALESFNHVIAINNKSSLGYRTLADTYSKMNKYDSAIKNYEKASKLDPKDAEIYNNWGIALAELAILKEDPTLFELSFNKYKKANKLNPKDAEIYTNWGNALANLAKLKKDPALMELSFNKYDKANKLNPKDTDIYTNWGIALADLAKLKEDPTFFELSFIKYKKANKLNPEDAKIYTYWGNALANLAKLKEDPALFELSFNKYKKAVKLKQDYYDAYNNWGIALAYLAKLKKDPALFELCFNKYEKAIQLDSINTNTLNAYAVSLSYLAQLENDYEPYKQKIEELLLKVENMKEGEGSYNLACLHSHVNEKDQAFEWLEKDLKINSSKRCRNVYEQDPDFDNIKSDPRFIELLDRYYPEEDISTTEK